jgi:hypothetical protein
MKEFKLTKNDGKKIRMLITSMLLKNWAHCNLSCSTWDYKYEKRKEKNKKKSLLGKFDINNLI